MIMISLHGVIIKVMYWQTVAQRPFTLRHAQGERYDHCYRELFPFVLSLSKHKIALGNSPLTIDSTVTVEIRDGSGSPMKKVVKW